jgi:ATP-dependent RNA helicase DeaD
LYDRTVVTIPLLCIRVQQKDIFYLFFEIFTSRKIMTTSFEELGLCPELLKAVENLGFEEPSPIQVLAVPPLLTGQDVVGQAQTGTGKTAAFGLPILEKITAAKNTQALVLCPTRELAIQVAEELGKLAMYKKGIVILPIYGGQPIERQFRALSNGAQVVVGTPGRVIDHLQRGTLHLEETAIAVLDEADEMLDMGFRDDIELILEKTAAHCQRVLFSATMPPAIRELSKRFLREPAMLTITQKILTVPAIDQVYYEVRPYQKMDALCRVLDSQGFRKALVFCSTKRSVDEVTMHLQQRGYQADALHGNLNQTQRDRVMSRFRTDGIEILVATDVAARGIDVDDVDAVINYDIPHDVESYVHRVGRTGRAGREGKAFTFVTVREHYKLHDIIRYTKARINQGQLPTLRDVNTIRTTRLLDEVQETLSAGSLERWLVLVEDFMTERFPDGEMASREVSAALLKLLMQRDFGNQDKAPEVDTLVKEERRAPRRAEGNNAPMRTTRRQEEDGPMTRLQINVGHVHKVTPRALVGAITGESGIPGRSIGAIDIQNTYSVVDIPTELAGDVLTILNGGVFICGTKVTVRVHTAMDTRKGAGSARRPHFGKFNKKPRGATSGKKMYRDPQ